MWKLKPNNGDDIFSVQANHWQALCRAAGVNPNANTLTDEECKRIATAVRSDPNVIHFDADPAYPNVIANFFEHSSGLKVVR